VYSTTAGGFLNFFTDGGALKNLKIVNEKWISDGTSNIAYVGGNVTLGAALDVVGNVAVDTNTLFVDSVGNKVGIGTTNPGKLLEISGASGLDNSSPVHFRITNTQSATIDSPFTDITKPSGLISFYTPDTSTAGPGDVAGIGFRPESTLGGDTALCFYTNSEDDDAGTPLQERMCITHDGNVGIGTTDPGHKLHVDGDIVTDQGHNINITRNDTSGGPSFGILNTDGTYSAWIGYGSSTVNNLRMVSNNNYPISFWTSASGDGVEKMRINADGNVGIGTATPNQRFVVAKTDNEKTTPVMELMVSTTFDNPSPNPSLYRLLDFSTNADGGKRHCSINLLNYNNSGSGQYDTTDRLKTGLGFSVRNGGSNIENALSINYLGRVGIGTASPTAILDVRGTVNKTYFAGRYFDASVAVSVMSTRTRTVGIYATGDIMTDALFLASSDRRIKKDIIDVNDSEALDTLRLLKPKTYKYKDTNTRGTESVYGFIAQDVSNVISNSTRLVEETIPNIYELADVSESNVITLNTFNTSDLEANTNTIQIMDINGTTHDATITSVIDEHTIRVAENLNNWSGSVDAYGNVITETTTTTLSVEEYEALESKDGYVPTISGYQSANVMISVEEYEALGDTTGYTEVVENYTRTMTTYPGNKLFVYGQRVTDFHSLNKNAIWTVATAALQEVDRQLQAEKVRNDALEARILALESA